MKILRDKEYKELQSQEVRIQELEQALKAKEELIQQKQVEIDGRQQVITPGASSSKDLPKSSFEILQKSLDVVTPSFNFEAIEVIRKLSIVNQDVNQALNDFTRLANTGHKIMFDPKVEANQIDEMREFINQSSKRWHVGAAGVNGCVNKMFRQIQIGGAISNEWIPNKNLDDLEELRFINAENIRYVTEKNSRGYQPYQKLRNVNIGDPSRELRKLNTSQFKYFALNGDEDIPYGIPPYISALDPIATQKDMVTNLKFVIKYLGAFGYLDAKIMKPDRKADESEGAYISRLEGILTKLKTRMLQGMKDGVNAGFLDETEFNFQSTSKDVNGVEQLFGINGNLISAGLGYDSIFRGTPGATETLVTVMFTKMLSQLKNTQDIIKENLEFGYRLVLTLAGFKFKTLGVQFNRSTITDDLKYQQAQEILLRNLVVKYNYGIVSSETMADELGYAAPDQKEPRIDINNVDPATGEVKKQKREEGKDASARKGREKKKPQGKTSRVKNDEARIEDSPRGKGKVIAIG